MPELVNLLRAFVSSPNDLREERTLLEEVVDELNQILPHSFNIRLELVKWETHSYPSMGRDVQSLINEQIGDDYDIFIGLMGNRFGTPTPRAASGTEEEFNHAYNRHLSAPDQIRILFYFKDAPVLPSQLDLDQLKRVNEFRASLEKEALISTYKDPQELLRLIRVDLLQHIRDFGKTWGFDNSIRSGKSVDESQNITSSEGITIRASKKVFARLNVEDSDPQNSFLIRYPIIEGLENEAVLQRINSLLEYERVFDISIREEIDEGLGISSLDFEVNYLSRQFLSITLTMEGIGAYPWQHSKNIVLNLETGRQLGATDLFNEESLGLLAERVDKLVQLDKAKAQLLLSYEEDNPDYTGDRFEWIAFNVEDLNHFRLYDSGLDFIYDFGFPHAIKCFEPEGIYFFSYTALKPFVKLDGPLGALNPKELTI